MLKKFEFKPLRQQEFAEFLGKSFQDYAVTGNRATLTRRISIARQNYGSSPYLKKMFYKIWR